MHVRSQNSRYPCQQAERHCSKKASRSCFMLRHSDVTRPTKEEMCGSKETHTETHTHTHTRLPTHTPIHPNHPLFHPNARMIPLIPFQSSKGIESMKISGMILCLSSALTNFRRIAAIVHVCVCGFGWPSSDVHPICTSFDLRVCVCV